MKYAHTDDNNKILGWYDTEIHTTIPTPNVEITDEVWQEAININANCYENGKFIVKDFRTDEEIEEARQASIKSICKEKIMEVYSYSDQLNTLANEDADAISTMNTIIKAYITISNNAIANGTALDDIDWTIGV